MEPRSFDWKFLPHILLPLVVVLFFEAAPLPYAVRIGLTEGRRAQSENQFELASVRLTQVVEQQPWRTGLWEEIGLAQRALGNQPAALAAFQNAWNLGVMSREGGYLLAESLEEVADWEGALRVWEDLAKAQPDSAQVFAHQTALYRRLGRIDQAAAAAKIWREYDPEGAHAAHQLGLILSINQIGDAVEQMEQAVDLDPAYIPARDALRRAANLALLSDDPAYGYTLVGRELAGLGEWDLAECAFQQATVENPNYAEAWAFLGEAQGQVGKDGLEALNQAVKINPNSVLAQALLALYWGRAGALDQAVSHLEMAARIEPERAVWKIELGVLTARKGDLQTALQYYQAATELEPENAQVWIELARFSITYNNNLRELGLPAAREAYRLSPEDGQVLDVMGAIFLGLGDLASAERFLHRALNLEPELVSAYLHLGQVYLIRNETEKARLILTQAVQLDPGGETGIVARRLLERQFPEQNTSP